MPATSQITNDNGNTLYVDDYLCCLQDMGVDASTVRILEEHLGDMATVEDLLQRTPQELFGIRRAGYGMGVERLRQLFELLEPFR